MIYVFRCLAIAAYTVFWGTIGVFLFPFDRGGRSTAWVAQHWIAWLLYSCSIRVEAEGGEFVERAQPCVIMGNHQSVFDIAALVHVLRVPWKFVAKRELLWVPFFGWALALAGQVIVDRRNRERAVQSLARAAQRVRGGLNVIIFPEGTRTQSHELGTFKSGGFYLAIEAGVPIVPVSVSGSRLITSKNSLRVESGRMRVRFGEPIPTEGLTADDRHALKARVREAILAGFDPELQAPGTPGGRPARAAIS